MAVEVGHALEKKRPVIIEAGTGMGKSLAYLLS
jgi:Rad3-related DNA helicase